MRKQNGLLLFYRLSTVRSYPQMKRQQSICYCHYLSHRSCQNSQCQINKRKAVCIVSNIFLCCDYCCIFEWNIQQNWTVIQCECLVRIFAKFLGGQCWISTRKRTTCIGEYFLFSFFICVLHSWSNSFCVVCPYSRK